MILIIPRRDKKVLLMELDQVIKERRSVRKFKKLDVPWYIVSECLAAAIESPSSGNVQNWRFVVVKDREKRERVIKSCGEQYWAINAPIIIVVVSELEKLRRLFGVRGEALYSVQNCAAAIENLLLKATELNLGATWIGAFDEMKIIEILEIKGDARPQAVIALGYGEDFDTKAKREPLDNFVYFDKWEHREDKERKKFTPVADTLKRVFKH